MNLQALFNQDSTPNATLDQLMIAVDLDLKAAADELRNLEAVENSLTELKKKLQLLDQNTVETFVTGVRARMKVAEGDAAAVQNRSAVVGALLAQIGPQ